MGNDKQKFRSLGSSSTKYDYTRPDPSILESFDNPFADKKQNPNGTEGTVHIEAPEFTTLCPVTGQPDFAMIVIDYAPDKKCVESKSLKLYLTGFRMFGEFHEACVNRIANDLVKLLNPRWLMVEGQFAPRGGIKFWPTAEYHRGKHGKRG